MTSSEDEEEYKPGQAVEIAVRKPPKKKRAVEGRSPTAATPARKPKEAGGGRGQSGGRGRGRGRGRGSGKATASSRVTSKKVTKKVSKAEALDSGGDSDEDVGPVNSRSVMRRSTAKKVVMRDINDSDDDEENSTSSQEQGGDSDWEFEENGGGKGKGRGKGHPRKERGDSSGTTGASKKVALSPGKGKRGGFVEGLSDESNEEKDFFVDDGNDAPVGGDAITTTTASVEEESVGSKDSGIINLMELEHSPSTESNIKSATGASGSAVSGKEEKSSSKASGSSSVNADASSAAAAAVGGKGKAKAGKDKGKGKAVKRDVLSTAKPAKLAGDVEVVLRRLRRLRDEMGEAGGGGGAADGEGDWDGKKAQTLLELGLGGDVTEVYI